MHIFTKNLIHTIMSCKSINSYIKISSLGLMIKHEQFSLNHSTKHIFSQKYIFENTVSGIVKPSVPISEKSQIIGSLSELAIHGHSRPLSHQSMIYFNISKLRKTHQPWQSRLHQWLLKNSHQFGPKVWDRSDGPSRPHSTPTFVKYLKRE